MATTHDDLDTTPLEDLQVPEGVVLESGEDDGPDDDQALSNVGHALAAPDLAEADSFSGMEPDDGAADQVEVGSPPVKEVGAEVSPGTESTLVDLDTLPDIAWASYGEPDTVGAESIQGSDDRVQITNTASYPWRVHCSLLITARDGSMWIGTGWFIGPKTVMTAGHCVFIRSSNPARHGWVRSVEVIPGRNGAVRPYGSVTSSNLRSVTGWVNSGRQRSDYGAIILSTPLGNSTGWLGFGNFSLPTIMSSSANLSGYPGDKPAGTQWYHADNVVFVSPYRVFYRTDTMGGHSGAAVYRLRNGARHAFAIHAYGGTGSNSGARITKGVFNIMKSWKNV